MKLITLFRISCILLRRSCAETLFQLLVQQLAFEASASVRMLCAIRSANWKWNLLQLKVPFSVAILRFSIVPLALSRKFFHLHIALSMVTNG